MHYADISRYCTGGFIILVVVVAATSNFHFDTIPSSLGNSIDGIEYNTDSSKLLKQDSQSIAHKLNK